MALWPRQANTALYILSLICCCLSHHQISQCYRLSSLVSLSLSLSSSRLSLGDNLSVDFASLHLCLLVSIYERLWAPFIAEQEVNYLSQVYLYLYLKSISICLSCPFHDLYLLSSSGSCCCWSGRLYFQEPPLWTQTRSPRFPSVISLRIAIVSERVRAKQAHLPRHQRSRSRLQLHSLLLPRRLTSVSSVDSPISSQFVLSSTSDLSLFLSRPSQKHCSCFDMVAQHVFDDVH